MCRNCQSELDAQGDCPNCGGPFAQAIPANFFDLDKFEKVSDDIISLDAIPSVLPNPDRWPKRKGDPRVLYDDLYHYRPGATTGGLSLAGPLAHCQLRLQQALDGSRTIALITEMSDNTGTRITNAIEEIASQIMNQFQQFNTLDPATTFFVEHYNPNSYGGQVCEESFALVMFQWEIRRARGGAAATLQNNSLYIASRPRWRHLNADDYLQLLKSLY